MDIIIEVVIAILLWFIWGRLAVIAQHLHTLTKLAVHRTNSRS